MHIEIRETAFEPWPEINRYQQHSTLRAGSYGACAAFVGSMRDFNAGVAVTEMYLEHYAGMTEKLLRQQAEQIQAEFSLLELLIVHRVGTLTPTEPIVLVATWAAHRHAAFASCEAMMTYLKSHATLWKQETLRGDPQHATQPPRQRWLGHSP